MFNLDMYSLYDKVGDVSIVKNRNTGLYGIAVKSKIFIDTNYHRIKLSEYHDGMLKVSLKNDDNCEVGYFEENANLAIPFFKTPSSNYCDDFSEGLAVITKSRKFFSFLWDWYYIDKSGSEVLSYGAGSHVMMGSFHEGLARVQPSISSGSYLEKKRPPWGFINRNGKIIIPATYFLAGDFNEGLCPVIMENNIGYLRLGFINNDNKMVIPLDYDWIVFDRSSVGDIYLPNFKNELVILAKNKLYGVVNKENKVVVDFRYKTIKALRKDFQI